MNVHAQSTESKQARRARRLREPDILNDPEGTGNKRQYIKITPEIEGTILAAKHMLGIAATHAAIAEEVGLPVRTVQYVLTEMPHLKRQKDGDDTATGSLKSRIYDVISTVMVVRDVHQLRELLGMGDDEHSIVHVLHSLHTQGRIDFDERGNGMGTATYVNIRMPKRRSTSTTTAPAGEPAEEAVAQDTAPVTPSQPAPEPEAYPLLTALAEREWRRETGDNGANAYITAAAAIEHVDPAMASDLLSKAEALAEPYPSPLEAEYLRYATAHRDVKATIDKENE